VTLVNVDQLAPRTVLVQAGGYAEHRFTSVSVGDLTRQLAGPHLAVTLFPGAGARLSFTMQRYVNQPTMALPW
jgi:hypothetical protein